MSVTMRSQSQESRRVGAPKLLERRGETAALGQALRSARARNGGLVVVEGAAGLGKSRLLAAAAHSARASGMSVVSARGNELERDFPFGVALQLYEPVLAAADTEGRARLLSGAAGLAAPLFEATGAGHGLPGEGASYSLVHGLYWIAGNMCVPADPDAPLRPLAVVVDDVQWVDTPSLRFLSYLAQRLEELPVAMIIALRPGERRPQRRRQESLDELLAQLRGHALARVLRPAPLSEEAVAQLVREGLSPRAEPEFCLACSRVTGGNPFLVRELVSELYADGVVPDVAAADRLARLAPESVLRAVLSRLARLPPGAAALARAVAVLGDAGTLRHAAPLAGLKPAAAAELADALTQVEILAPGEPLRFAHALIGNAIYSDLPRLERGRSHLRAARLLADEGAPLDRVAAHLVAGAPDGDRWAVAQLRAAARQAMTRGAPEAAARDLERALREPPPAAERADVLIELGDAQARTGSPSANETLDAAIALLDDPRARAAAHRRLGGVLYGQGRHSEAADAFKRGLAERVGVEDALTRDLRAAFVATATLDSGRRASAIGELALLLEHLEDDQTPAERVLLAQAALQKALAGDPAEDIRALAERAWGDGALLAEEGPDGQAWNLITGALTWAEAYAESEAVASTVLEEARRRGSVIAFASASYCRSVPVLLRGRVSEALADVDQALGARRYGWEMFVGAASWARARALLEQGELDGADQALALADDPRYESSIERPLMLEGRGRLRLAQARPREALADCLQAGRLFEGFGASLPALAPWQLGAALAALGMGDREQARGLVDAAAEAAARLGAPGAIGATQRVAGLVERGAEGVARLRDAVATLERSSATLELVRALVDLGGALRRAGSRTESREPLGRGLELAHRCGATALERRAREELQATGARPRRIVQTGAEALTASERRVAHMAADGLGNREIAQGLFVTTKAVEFHLRHAYAKLGIRSRKQLAGALSG